MARLRIVGLFVLWCCVGSLLLATTPDIAQANPTVSARYYNGNPRIKYYRISGLKYRAANDAMKAYAREAYLSDQDALEAYAELSAEDPESYSRSDFFCQISPRISYSARKRLSIVYTERFSAGGVLSTNHRSFNLVDGKRISLNQAFESRAKYYAANTRATQYWQRNWEERGLSWQPDTADARLGNRPFYWTKTGLTVIYEAGSLAANADGAASYKVPRSYLRY